MWVIVNICSGTHQNTWFPLRGDANLRVSEEYLHDWPAPSVLDGLVYNINSLQAGGFYGPSAHKSGEWCVNRVISSFEPTKLVLAHKLGSGCIISFYRARRASGPRAGAHDSFGARAPTCVCAPSHIPSGCALFHAWNAWNACRQAHGMPWPFGPRAIPCYIGLGVKPQVRVPCTIPSWLLAFSQKLASGQPLQGANLGPFLAI